MEAAIAFAVSGENMEFAIYHIREGHPTPPALFIDILVEKCQLINHHFCNTQVLFMTSDKCNKHGGYSKIS